MCLAAEWPTGAGR